MKLSLLTELRDHTTPTPRFRAVADKLTRLIAAELADEIAEEQCTVTTPIKQAAGFRTKEEVVLVSILRAGLAMLPAFMELFELSRIGLFGIRRDEKTALPSAYYESLPFISGDDKVFLLDPMIATAGSSIMAIERLIKAGAREEKIVLVSLLAAPEGIKALDKVYPRLKKRILAIDDCLNDKKFIEPGLGDFGDRFFGTPS